MGIFDKAKDLADQHPDQVNQGVDKAGDAFDQKTDGKFADQTDKAQEAAHNQFGGGQQAPQGEQPPADQPPA